ncbi:unnamed protein product [Parajaminaea phylloscopi]
MWPFSSSPSSSTAQPVADPSSSSTFPPSAPAAAAPQQPAADETSPTAYLASHQFSNAPSSSYDPAYTPSASDIFAGQGFDSARLNPFAGLGKEEVEYLDIVDNQPNQIEGARTALPGRGWSDDLSYGTGTTYLSGLVLGGALGAREGLFRPLGVDHPTARLRLNAMLNQMTRRASFMGNSAGVIGERRYGGRPPVAFSWSGAAAGAFTLTACAFSPDSTPTALIYNSIDAIIDNVRGVHDMPGAIAAGAISGGLFKATAGVRPALVASGIMAAAAATWTAAKQQFL